MKQPKLTKQPIYKDNRGQFIPMPIYDNWVQSNISFNDNPYVLRGVHLQKSPKRQTKQITVLKGKIIDFIVCLKGENIGKVNYFILEEGDSLFIPKNYAHGFLTLKSGTIVQYFVDEIYSKSHEISILWNSIPEIKDIVEEFLGENKLTISDKDNDGIEFEKFLENELRPV